MNSFGVWPRAGCWFFLFAWNLQICAGNNNAFQIEIRRDLQNTSAASLSSTFSSNSVLLLEASTDLQSWDGVGTFHDKLFPYRDAAALNLDQRFYRLRAVPRTTTNDWKNQILFPRDVFPHPPNSPGAIPWVKFIILPGDPVRVYYQDSQKYPFHYEFAAQRLRQFKGMTREAFDEVSLHRSNQQAILGSVLYAPFLIDSGSWFMASRLEYGVQFVGKEPYTPDEIARWFHLVQNSVFASNDVTAFYMPTFEQREMVRTNLDAFAERGIKSASVERWLPSDDCYSPGWAVGTLKFFTAADITPAFNEGRLRSEDILLTDGVPAKTPLVSAIISLTPVTPNSHAVILSQSFGTPLVYLSDTANRQRAQALLGHRILLRATISLDACLVKMLDLESLNDPGFEAELLAAKRPWPIEFVPKHPYGAFSSSTGVLVPSDIQYFGGKAANFSLLRRAIPQNCPQAIAFSFDLWDAFLGQALPNGRTLRTEIAARLAPFTNYPPDMPTLSATLAGIRDLFTKTAAFTSSQQQAITNALAAAGFNPRRNIRFRSSTNIEDSEHFTGAGLYDSFSGCLMDDLDTDAVGPCQCDGTQTSEHGVFRAIQKVYASFYNDNAFLARWAHGVDESTAGMGVLVHHSFPDEDELANGVATLHYASSSYGTILRDGQLVTQAGAASVTNPDGSSSPEIGQADGISFFVKQYSSLVTLGKSVLNLPWEYNEFLRLFGLTATEFAKFYPQKRDFYLDFEYKKDRNLGLVVKQVREIPGPGAATNGIAFLIDEPVTLAIAPQESGDAFTYHRLKSLLALHTRTMRLTDENVAQGIYTQGTFQYVEDGGIRTLSGPLDSWPGAVRSPSGTTNYWTTGTGTNQRAWRLQTALTTTVASSAEPAVFTQSDYTKTLGVTYSQPLADGKNSESVYLRTYPTGEGVLQQRTLSKANVVEIETLFYWPKFVTGPGIGPTGQLERFVQTRITGLTSNAMILTNYFSQTYSTSRHNFREYFLFEPRLEPGISPAVLAELEAADIQEIYVIYETGYALLQSPAAHFAVIGRDGSMREL